MPSRSRSLVTVALASAVVTGCSARITTQPARPVPVTEVAASVLSSAVVAPATYATTVENAAVATEIPMAGGTTVIVQVASDPEQIALGAPVSSTVERALTRAGFHAVRTETTGVTAAFVVSPTVHALTITTEGSSTTIACRVTLRVAPWTGVERWEPSTTASASGEARATTSNSRDQITLGIADCFEGAVRAAATRQVIPFLRECEVSGQE